MTEPAVPVETSVGTISGRNGIYLDSVVYTLCPDTLTLAGELNASLCSNGPKSGKWIPYTIRFDSVMYLQIVELDLDTQELVHQSSFDLMQYSQLVASLRTADRDNKITPEHKHFSFCTYDRIFEIVSIGYDLDVGEPRPA